MTKSKVDLRNPIYHDDRKARDHLGWIPRVGLEELAGMMMKADLDRVARNMSK